MDPPSIPCWRNSYPVTLEAITPTTWNIIIIIFFMKAMYWMTVFFGKLKLKMKLKLKTKQKATISINSMIFTVVVHYQILTVFSAIFSSPIISTSTLFIKNGFYNRLAHKIAVAKGDGPVKRKNK